MTPRKPRNTCRPFPAESVTSVNAATGPPPRFPIKQMLKRSLGVNYEAAVELSDDPRFLTGVVPSGNVVTTADDACRFYQLLLNGGELDGVRICDRRTVRRATAEQTYLELDMMLAMPVRYGMGFMLGADYLSFYGPRTPEAFGHLGFSNVVTWADHQRNLSAALLTSGKPIASLKVLKWYDIMRTINRVCDSGH